MKKTQLYDGLLQVAQLPPDNPQIFSFAKYDITPIDHDYAGQFQKKANYVFKKLGMDIGLVMMVGDPENATAIYDAFRHDERYLGGGTGSGFKNKAPEVLDELDPLAEKIGAINVVVKKDKKLIGYNTDGTGFMRGIEEYFDAQNKTLDGLSVLLLGAGGTADAIAFALAERGVNMTILNRTTEKADKLAERVREAYDVRAEGGGEDAIASAVLTADVIINATTKGAEGRFAEYVALAPAGDDLDQNLKESAEVFEKVRPDVLIVDINLRSTESPTLTLARKRTLPVMDGMPMNLYQAVEALWLIHGEQFQELGVSKEKIAELVKDAS